MHKDSVQHSLDEDFSLHAFGLINNLIKSVCVCVCVWSELVTQSRSVLLCFAFLRDEGRERQRDGEMERGGVLFGKWVKRKLRVCFLKCVCVCVHVMLYS